MTVERDREDAAIAGLALDAAKAGNALRLRTCELALGLPDRAGGEHEGESVTPEPLAIEAARRVCLRSRRMRPSPTFDRLTPCTVRYSADGRTEAHSSYAVAVAAMALRHDGCVIGHPGDMTDGGARTLVWASPADGVPSAHVHDRRPGAGYRGAGESRALLPSNDFRRRLAARPHEVPRRGLNA